MKKRILLGLISVIVLVSFVLAEDINVVESNYFGYWDNDYLSIISINNLESSCFKFGLNSTKNLSLNGKNVFVEFVESHEDDPSYSKEICKRDGSWCEIEDDWMIVSFNGENIEFAREEVKEILFDDGSKLYFVAPDIEGGRDSDVCLTSGECLPPCSVGYVCLEEECVQTETTDTTCYDSDGGIDYYVKGTINESGVQVSDFCLNPNKIREWYCTDAGALEKDYECNCEEGECKEVSSGCSEAWSCIPWSTCINSQQTRTCTDLNFCGTTANKPSTSKTCTDQQQQQTFTQPKSYIRNKEVSVERNIADRNIIKVEDDSIETSLDVIEESEKIYIKTSEGNKEIKILTEEAITKAQKIDTIEKIEILEEKGKAVYSISGTKRARLFFIFPVLAEVQQNVNVEDGSLISTKKPWWHFLALGV